MVDDGWFVGRDDDHRGLGDWTPDPAKFPDGFGAFVDGVRSRGLTSGCGSSRRWSTPGPRCTPSTPTGSTRPTADPARTIRNQYLLNLGRPDVSDFVLSTFDDLLRAYPISLPEMGLQPPAHRGGPVRVGDLDGAHVHNLYRILDHLRAAHPGVTDRGLRGRRRPGRPGDGRAHRRASGPATTPRRWTACASSTASCHAYAPHLMSSWVTDAPGLFDERAAVAGVPLRAGDARACSASAPTSPGGRRPSGRRRRAGSPATRRSAT